MHSGFLLLRGNICQVLCKVLESRPSLRDPGLRSWFYYFFPLCKFEPLHFSEAQTFLSVKWEQYHLNQRNKWDTTWYLAQCLAHSNCSTKGSNYYYYYYFTPMDIAYFKVLNTLLNFSYQQPQTLIILQRLFIQQLLSDILCVRPWEYMREERHKTNNYQCYKKKMCQGSILTGVTNSRKP